MPKSVTEFIKDKMRRIERFKERHNELKDLDHDLFKAFLRNVENEQLKNSDNQRTFGYNQKKRRVS